jgi:hypothetical protein
MNNIDSDSDSQRPKFSHGSILPIHRQVSFHGNHYLRDIRLCDTVCKLLTWLCLFIAVAIILGVSIKAVESTEYGIQYDVHTKYLKDSPYSGGLFMGPPG